MTILCIVLLVLGSLMLAGSLREQSRASKSVHWPMLAAEVLESGVERHRGRHQSYTPVVRYRYQHEGKDYEGKQFKFSGLGLMTYSKEDAQQFIAKFEKGERITVRISPTNPRISVIDPGVDRRNWLALFIAGMLVFMGLGGLLGLLR